MKVCPQSSQVCSEIAACFSDVSSPFWLIMDMESCSFTCQDNMITTLRFLTSITRYICSCVFGITAITHIRDINMYYLEEWVNHYYIILIVSGCSVVISGVNVRKDSCHYSII